MQKILLLSVLCTLFSSPMAIAGPVRASNPESVTAALQNAGYKAKFEKGADGDPKITTASEGNDIILQFMNCTAGKNCKYIEMIALWNCENNMLDKCKAANQKWNAAEHFAQTLLFEKSIAMYYYIDLDADGISDILFVDTIKMVSNSAVELEKTF